ncbi:MULTISPECIES: hypothetical protein [Sphingobacterium]|uniref:hypothetical protein n=1 Tax=Sphingobacterium TaxID=28453 RepID=UPI00257EC695|nr:MULTISPECIES: hypothetical protein [Sphingobacterium]
MNRSTSAAKKQIRHLLRRTVLLFYWIPIWQRICINAIFGLIPPKVHVRRIWYANKFALFTVYAAHWFQGDR